MISFRIIVLICRKGNRRGNFCHWDWLVFRLGSLSFVNQEKGLFQCFWNRWLDGQSCVEKNVIPNQWRMTGSRRNFENFLCRGTFSLHLMSKNCTEVQTVIRPTYSDSFPMETREISGHVAFPTEGSHNESLLIDNTGFIIYQHHSEPCADQHHYHHRRRWKAVPPKGRRIP